MLWEKAIDGKVGFGELKLIGQRRNVILLKPKLWTIFRECETIAFT